MEYVSLFQRVKEQTGMYLRGESYNEAVAFVLGCDAGNDWCLLHGFREWLVVRCHGPNNLVWSSLVLHVAFPDEQDPDIRSEERNRKAVAVLVDLLVEFMNVRQEPDGLRAIFDRYSVWLQTQPWYQGRRE
jgi:hypothetical protein